MLEENRSWLQPTYLDPATDKIILCFQSYIVRTPQHNILVDTCFGNRQAAADASGLDHDEERPLRERPGRRRPQFDDIDYVMCTHLHIDHVGWNTRLENGRWVPTFPKARYLFAERELAFWTEKEKEEPAAWPWITDSVLPIVAAKRAEVVKSDHALNDLVQLVPTPGHTIDHFSVHVGKPGAGRIHHRRHDPLAPAGALSRARHAGRL